MRPWRRLSPRRRKKKQFYELRRYNESAERFLSMNFRHDVSAFHGNLTVTSHKYQSEIDIYWTIQYIENNYQKLTQQTQTRKQSNKANKQQKAICKAVQSQNK